MLYSTIAQTSDLKPGNIILVKLPQADGCQKQRPAIILEQMPGHGDFLVCGISSQLKQEIPDFDEVISPDLTNGLKTDSVIRLGFLKVVPECQIVGKIGRVTDAVHVTLLRRLAEYLMLRIEGRSSG